MSFPSVEQDGGPDELPVYALRIVGAARTDIDEAHAYVEATSGTTIADLWEEGLFDAIARMATLPYRYPVAPEADALGLPVRGFSYRRPFSGSSALAYRVLYLVEDNGERFGEGPIVMLLMVRHGARRPLTRREGRTRRENLNEN